MSKRETLDEEKSLHWNRYEPSNVENWDICLYKIFFKMSVSNFCFFYTLFCYRHSAVLYTTTDLVDLCQLDPGVRGHAVRGYLPQQDPERPDVGLCREPTIKNSKF